MQWHEILSTDTAQLEERARELNIHPLALEDCLHRDQRAKLEDYGHHQLLVWFMFHQHKIYELQFLILSDQILFVPHDPPPGGFLSWKDFFQLTDEKMKDPPHTIFQALDRATDLSYFEVRNLVSRIETFEQKLFKGTADIKSILPVKKKLGTIEFVTEHHPQIAQQLQNLFQPKDDLKWRFRDLRDHSQRLYERVIFHQTQIISSFELHWVMASQKTNLQIKKLTLLASISVPVTFWASFWGMNFQSIPFESPVFFAFAMLLMVATAAGVYFFLRHKGYWNDN